MDEVQARADLVAVASLCYERGYICGTEGNFSLRLDGRFILTTPAGTCKGRLSPADLIKLELDDEGVPCAESLEGAARPSTELSMHLTALKERSDVQAIVHAHPTVTVGFSVAGRELSICILPEVVSSLGFIPVAPYGIPGTEEVSASIEPYLADHDVIVLDHHGILTFGEDIWQAYYKLETVEHQAQTLLVAELLGGARPLTRAQVMALIDNRHIYGLTRPLPVDRLTSSPLCRPDPEELA